MTDTEERHYVAARTEEAEPFEELNLEKLTMRYSDEIADFAMQPVDLSLKAGETMFVMGGNGSGETTLLKLLSGLYTPDEGIVRLNGQLRPISGSSRTRVS